MPFKSKFKFTKIYFPGLISLSCLPLLAVTLLFATGTYSKQHMLRVIHFSGYEADHLKYSFSVNADSIMRLYIAKITPRIHNVYVFDGRRDSILLNDFRMKAGKLANVNDTMPVIRVLFTNKTTYSTMVSVLDIACSYQDKNLCYVYYDNDVYLFKINSAIVDLEHDVLEPKIKPMPL